MLTVIMPCFNEGSNIKKAVERTSEVLKKSNISFELLFVDDGSADETWTEIKKQIKENKNVTVKGIRFSRNYGKEAAIQAGLKNASGDCMVLMDCDLQHPPEKIPEMYEKWKEGYEIVEGRKKNRGKESAFHKFAANIFYGLISKATAVDMAAASDFKLLDQSVVKALGLFKEHCYFFRALSSSIGFKKTQVYFEVEERTEGTSKWNLKSLVRYAINNIAANTNAPLYLPAFLLAFLSAAISFLFLLIPGNRWIAPIFCFISSIIGLILGIMGYYIGKIFDETKDRPSYIIAEMAGMD